MPWREGIRAHEGMDPHIPFFETAYITDNAVWAVPLPDVPDDQLSDERSTPSGS